LIPHNRAPVAFLIANEWENQKQILKNHALPMVSSCSFFLSELAFSLELPYLSQNSSSRMYPPSTSFRRPY